MDTELIKASGLVVGAIAVGCVMLNASEHHMQHTSTDALEDTMSQCDKFHMQSEQDTNSTLKYEHLVQAQAYLNVARRMASDATIEQHTRKNVRALSRKIESEIQVTHAQMLPKVSKNKSSFKKASWM